MVSRNDPALPENRSELEAVLQSKEFVRSPALAKLLDYLCQKTFSGHFQEIKEFSIATEVFGRDRDFGEKRDSFVRVEVHRLRKKLQHYYASEGAGRPVHIVIRPGNYQPSFERVAEAQPAPAADSQEPTETGPPVEPAVLLAPVVEKPWSVSRWLIAGAAVLALLVTARVTMTGSARSDSRKIPPRPSQPVAVLPAAQQPQPVRILVGSSAAQSVDRFGTEWRGDRYFSGGDQNLVRFGSQERAVRHPFILGAPDQTLFRNFRVGDFSYKIPLSPGKYEMRLYFSEVVLTTGDFGEGAENQRVFDVTLNEQPLLTFFDIYSDAGGPDRADIRVFENVSPQGDGFLRLAFRPVRESAWLNAIELIPNSTGKPLPLRIIARNANYTDRKDRLWSSDRYFIGGRAASDGKEPSGTEDPELFAAQRYGHFSYRLPAPPGKYTLRLLFAETFFGPSNRGKGGAGSRVFNVYCSGVALLRQFDVFKEVGENRPLEKVFRGVAPNAQGRIELTFEPVTNYAIVQAIELIPEDGG